VKNWLVAKSTHRRDLGAPTTGKIGQEKTYKVQENLIGLNILKFLVGVVTDHSIYESKVSH